MKSLLILVATFILLIPSVHAEIAGVVLLATGNTFATNQEGVQRSLKRRSKILEGDIITTADNSKLQIRFVDKALLTLKASSKLNVSNYQLAKNDNESEKVVMNLITGGFRTITGSIGKGDKSAYTVNTPAASIGIRGTNYEIAQEKNGEFVIAVWDGGITVTNEQGSINVGSHSEFNFVRVKEDKEPEGLEEQPTALTDTSPTQAEGKDSQEANENEEQDEANTEDTSDDKNDDSQSKKTTSDKASNSKEESDDSNETAKIPSASEEGTKTVDAAAASEGSAQESELVDEVAKAEESATNQAEEPFPDLIEVISPDGRFDNIEYTFLLKRPRAGMLINTDSASPVTAIENALTVQDSINENILKVNLPGSQSGAYNLDSFSLNLTDSNNTLVETQVENSEYVSWGKWNGTVSLTDNIGTTTTPNKNFYWLSAEAANLSSLRGEVNFSGSEGIGDINGSAITNLDGKFDVNFANGNIENGHLKFANENQTWDMSFDGSVTGVNATMDNIQGDITGASSCSTCINGDIQGIFARPGDHFVGGFSLESSTSADTANGLFSLKETP